MTPLLALALLAGREAKPSSQLQAGDATLSFAPGCARVSSSSGVVFERVKGGAAGAVAGKGLTAARLAISGWYRDAKTREELFVFDCAVEAPRACVPAVFYRRNEKARTAKLGVKRVDLEGGQPVIDTFFTGKPAETYALTFAQADRFRCELTLAPKGKVRAGRSVPDAAGARAAVTPAARSASSTRGSPPTPPATPPR